MRDSLYQKVEYALHEQRHAYGPHVHLVGSPYLLTLLARLSAKETEQPLVNTLVRTLYTDLVTIAVNCEFPRKLVTVPTRMIEHTPKGLYQGEVLDETVRAVSVNIARAGTLPSQVTYDLLNTILEPKRVRQDHLIMSRELDPSAHVVGSSIGGAKIGGDVDDAMVLFPDPMGATGSSLATALNLYKTKVAGKPRRIISLNLIVTPEFIRRLTTDHPDVIIYAVRLDRGLSQDSVLSTVPGSLWEQERGLDDHDYIVPGAGGMGEVMNNAYV
jgi:uracil phosphoribosyltransferase